MIEHQDKFLHFALSFLATIVLSAFMGPSAAIAVLGVGAGKEYYDYKCKSATRDSMVWDFFADGVGAMLGFIVIVAMIL